MTVVIIVFLNLRGCLVGEIGNKGMSFIYIKNVWLIGLVCINGNQNITTSYP